MQNSVTLNNGSQLYYEWIEGNQDNPCLVFLHEGLGSVSMWREFAEQLCQATGCCGLLYDRQGYGQSATEDEKRSIHYLHDYALQELPQVLRALLPERDYVLVGHSDGGSIALLHAAEKPNRLKGIVTEAAHVFVEDITIAGIEKAVNAWHDGKLHKLEKFHGAKTKALFHAWSDIWLSDGFRYWNIEYLLPSIECPSLIIQGEDDQYGTDLQVETIVSKIQGRTNACLIANCGHSPHHEQSEEVISAIKAFVADRV